MRRAGGPARRCSPLGNGIRPGNGLGIFFIGRLAIGESLLVFIGDFDRANLGTFAAAGTLIQIDMTRLPANPRGETARFAVQPKKFGIGENFDVQMPADLDQFR